MAEIKFYHEQAEELRCHKYFNTYVLGNEFVMNTTGVMDTVWECIVSDSHLAQEELFRRLPSAC